MEKGKNLMWIGFGIIIITYFAWLFSLIVQHSNEAGYIQAALTAIPNFVLVIITFFYVLLTRDLVKTNQDLLKTNQELVKAQTQPAVIVYVQPDAEDIRQVKMIIENIGLGIARNIHFTVEPRGVPTLSNKPLDEVSLIQKGLPILGPKQKFCTTTLWYLPPLFDEIRAGSKRREDLRFRITIIFQNSLCEDMKPEQCDIDLGIWEDL